MVWAALGKLTGIFSGVRGDPARVSPEDGAKPGGVFSFFRKKDGELSKSWLGVLKKSTKSPQPASWGYAAAPDASELAPQERAAKMFLRIGKAATGESSSGLKSAARKRMSTTASCVPRLDPRTSDDSPTPTLSWPSGR